MKIYILTEGSRHTGFGHITRCTSLYQAFEEKGITPLFIINGDETVIDLLKDKNYIFLNWLEERKELFSMVADGAAVIIDSYMTDLDIYKRLSQTVKIPVYIDDNRRLDYPDGIIVNGTIGSRHFGYPQRPGISYLLGGIYMPLRKEFWEMPEKPVKDTVQNMLITFGGDDWRNMTPKIMRLLRKKYPEHSKNVVIGKGFQNIEEITHEADKETDLIYYPDAEGMKRVMLESDLAITAGGQTLYELARVGVPTVAISVADNQMNNVTAFRNEGALVYAGWYQDLDILRKTEDGIGLLHEKGIRERMSKAGRSLVDGEGAMRIIQEVLRRADYNKEGAFD
ncbi:MAG: glycosyltransferase [Nitrospirota bacterium]